MGKDTGFPEPLSHDRNTTLPHPEADTSPYASLESKEVDIYRTHSRLSFKRHHSKHKVSTLGTPLYEHAEDSREHMTIEEHAENGDDLMDPPKTVEEYVEMEDRDDQGYKQGERKKGVLRKLNLHKG